jgi:hypothetical protein
MIESATDQYLGDRSLRTPDRQMLGAPVVVVVSVISAIGAVRLT